LGTDFCASASNSWGKSGRANFFKASSMAARCLVDLSMGEGYTKYSLLLMRIRLQ
jgi:hypothetical protein